VTWYKVEKIHLFKSRVAATMPFVNSFPEKVLRHRSAQVNTTY